MQPEVRMARYVEASERYRVGRLSCIEAAELLGISERHFRRLRERYEAAGAEGLIDRWRGAPRGGEPPVYRDRVCGGTISKPAVGTARPWSI